MAIESGVPIPKFRNRDTVSGNTADAMMPGDSVICGDDHAKMRLTSAMRYRGMQYATRKASDGSGWRVWRLT